MNSPFKRLGAAMILPLIFGVCVMNACSKTTIPAEQAEALVAAGATLVDVRTPEEYQGGHIRGAVNVPVDQLPARMQELGPKDQPLVLYCKAGKRAHRGAEALRAAGYTHVHELGAMKKWTGPGAP